MQVLDQVELRLRVFFAAARIELVEAIPKHFHNELFHVAHLQLKLAG